MKAIIIGGGIGGLTVGLALRKVGIDARIYERAPVLREVGSGIGLSDMAVRILDTLGLGGPMRARSLFGFQGGLRNAKGDVLFEIPPDEFVEQFGRVAVLHRAELLDLLVQEMEPGRLHLGWECIACEQDRNGVTALFANGETVRGDVLIGADGMKSAVRSQVIGVHPPRYAGYTAWRAVVNSDSSGLNIVETWGRGRRFGMVPMSGGRIYWFATKNTPEGERDREGDSRQTLLKLFRGWHEPIEALIEAATEGSILRNEIYDLAPLRRWVDKRIALLGDAAHAMTPDLGQGACQAIEDAVVLAACLSKNSGIDSALLEYQGRRVARATQFVRGSRLLGWVAQLENPFLCQARDTAIGFTPRWAVRHQFKSATGFEILTAAERMLFQTRN